MIRFGSLAVVAGVLLSAVPDARGQGTRADYVRAERFLGANATALVAHDQVRPVWLGPTRFWFEDRTHTGREWVVVDVAAGTRQPLFDRARIAARLSVMTDTSLDATTLRLTNLEVGADLSWILFQQGRRWWRCELAADRCVPADTTRLRRSHEIRSPDGRSAAFERDGNLWIRSLVSGDSTQLTTDGTPDYGYGTNRFCCDRVTSKRFGVRKAPVLSWSPDSKKIFAPRLDERRVTPLAILETRPGRPVLHTYPYAMAGDSIVPMLDYHIIDVATRGITAVDRPAHPADMLTLVADSIWNRVRWNATGTRVFFVTGVRAEKQYDLIEVDPTSGRSRLILSEKRSTHVDLHPYIGQIAWQPVGDGNELIWFSERDGWGHLYLIDAATGAIKRRLTEGPWMVSDLVRVDPAERAVWFTATGREAGRDPYFRMLYRVGLDGGDPTLLTPEPGDHEVSVAPDGRHFVDTYSQLNVPSVSVVRDRTGRVVREVTRADISRLAALGWPAPIPFTVKARDGVTDLYGVMFRPSTFDSTKQYPVLDYIYPGPQTGPIGFRSFSATAAGSAQAFAELGFVVLAIDAMGTPVRSKAFHDFYYGNMGDNGIPDHVTAIRQLASRHAWLDLDRVGIFGHSGGGFSSARAMLMFPDFFKVAVSSAGNFDQRGYTYQWGEKYQGPLVRQADGTDSYANQDVQSLARNLKGKLLLAYGTLDDNVHPNLTLVLIDELIKANKTFDVLVLPNRNHGFFREPYFVRRTWDYLVLHLLGVAPPEDFALTVAPGQ